METNTAGPELLKLTENINEFKPGKAEVTEKDLLLTAKQILFSIMVILFLAGFADFINPLRGGPLLDICKTILPPFATLIVAYYYKEKS